MVLHWCLEESGDVIQPGDCQWLTTGQQQCHNVQQLKIWWGCRKSWWKLRKSRSIFTQIWNSSPNPVTASDSQTISSSSLRVPQCTLYSWNMFEIIIDEDQGNPCSDWHMFETLHFSDCECQWLTNSQQQQQLANSVFLSVSVFAFVWAHRCISIYICIFFRVST